MKAGIAKVLNKVDVWTGKHPSSMNRDTDDDRMEAQHGDLGRNCYGVARNPNQVSQKTTSLHISVNRRQNISQ